MKLTVLSIGKERSGLFKPGVDEYAKRLSHVAKLELVELPESRRSGAQAKADEAEAILSRLKPTDVLVALDEAGKALASVPFAKWLETHQSQGRHVVFVIGGDEGLDASIRARAQLTLSLSAMTMPHRLARLVLMEQLYRAFSILRGEPYHKA
ncbi:MAG: 23S rRNA (pseudouridine(1915)-N(3))-methyltransferase RlmH [Myxococcaceae bacterium]|nr:23S rRNA (pseudouridine(1915)-N(3))-methyltransferase RlmH [Myxococcaceae bacterium]